MFAIAMIAAIVDAIVNARGEDAAPVRWLGGMWLIATGFSAAPAVNALAGGPTLATHYGDFVQAAYVLFVAFGVAYPVLRHRLVDLNILVSRATVFTIVSTIIVGLFIAAERGIGKVFEESFGLSHSSSGLAAQFLTLLIVLALGMSARSIHGFVEERLTKAFFRTHLTNRWNDRSPACVYPAPPLFGGQMNRLAVLILALLVCAIAAKPAIAQTSGTANSVSGCNEQKLHWESVYAKEVANWHPTTSTYANAYVPAFNVYPEAELKIDWQSPTITASCDAHGHLTVAFTLLDTWSLGRVVKDTWLRLWTLRLDGHLDPNVGFDPKHPFAGVIRPVSTALDYDHHGDSAIELNLAQALQTQMALIQASH